MPPLGSLLYRPPPAPRVALPKSGPLTMTDKLMTLAQGLLGVNQPDPEEFQTPEDFKQADRWHGLGELASLAPALAAPMMALKAYHGSPHDFNSFSLSKVGTGEGGQAYGHGLYFAENPSVAAAYKKAGVVDPRDAINNAIKGAYHISGPEKLSPEVMRDWMVREGVKREHITPDLVDAALEAARGQSADGSVSPAALKAYQRLDRALGDLPKGKSYEVNIHASPDELLDWDKPLSQQPPKVQQGVRSAFPEIIVEKTGQVQGDPTGAQIYQLLTEQAGGRVGHTEGISSQKLKDAGIKGIQYLDQGSRAAGEGTKNFVIFDDKIIEIAKKYGLSLPVAASLYKWQQSQQSQKGVE